MGDVIGFIDSSGDEIVQYEYDEWGTLGSLYTPDDSEEEIALANINPIRYRGYYFDAETGYYYLQSRYYDSSICRFINADISKIVSITKDMTAGINVFAYCCNDAVNNSDPSGYISIEAFLRLANISMSAYNNFLCVRLYTWGFVNRKKNQIYDFSKLWGSKIISLMKKSSLMTSKIKECIKYMQKNKMNYYVKYLNLSFYGYHKSISDVDLILSIGGGAHFTLYITKVGKTFFAKTKYKIVCNMSNEKFDFSHWTKSNAHSNSTFIRLINNIGSLSQKVGAFVDFTFFFSVSFDYNY